MAGGPHAAVVGCLHCFGPADRTEEGIEDDLYRCRECGKQFGVDWSGGPADKPCWPPTPAEQALMDQLRVQRQGAAPERSSGFVPSLGRQVDRPMMIKQPSAFLPVAMSVAALATVLGHLAMFGAAREADEGGAAHLFQLLLLGQVPIVAYFAMKWLPRAPQQAILILALQGAAALAALALVYYLQL